jgi:hypothetical protein
VLITYPRTVHREVMFLSVRADVQSSSRSSAHLKTHTGLNTSRNWIGTEHCAVLCTPLIHILELPDLIPNLKSIYLKFLGLSGPALSSSFLDSRPSARLSQVSSSVFNPGPTFLSSFVCFQPRADFSKFLCLFSVQSPTSLSFFVCFQPRARLL